jgi:hypothetical protein
MFSGHFIMDAVHTSASEDRKNTILELLKYNLKINVKVTPQYANAVGGGVHIELYPL